MNSKRRKGQFDFKKFSIIQEKTAMKVGTDGVLLGAWTDIGPAKLALDIGTGTGLIALMLAQRKDDLKIDGVEIDESAFTEAKHNVSQSPWDDRINIIKGTIQTFTTTDQYDLIVSNPPYFTAGTRPPGDDRWRARHSIGFTPEQLISVADDLLAPDGRLCLILPTREGNNFIKLATEGGLFLTRQTAFYPMKTKPQERWLLEFGKKQVVRGHAFSELVQYDEHGDWTPEYKVLTRDFYVKL